jgi:hypothetical protein
VAAWQQGITGEGQTIAIIDTGIDIDSPEFAGRIHPDSRDVAGNRTFNGEDDHGTNVALVAAGARDDTGALGIAFDADLLILRGDSPGTCGPDSPENTDLGCSFFDRDIAEGINQAVDSGARVINISLGGGSTTNAVRNAVARAADAGIVVVVAAGNGGDGTVAGVDPDNPNLFAQELRQAGNGNVIIVGSVDANNQVSDFSQRAGIEANSFLSARGERICCVYENGEVFIGSDEIGTFRLVFSGTSFATPQVAGAVALLAQAFPNLTGQDIVSILLDTASDAGAAGTDNIFGRGILDIEAAISPIGTTSLAGSTANSRQGVVSIGASTGVGSPAMGDALTNNRGLEAIVLDDFNRAFQLDIASGLRNASIQPRLASALSNNSRHVSLGSEALSVAFTIDNQVNTSQSATSGTGLDAQLSNERRSNWARQLQLTPEQAQGARVLAARLAARIAPDTQFGFALREGTSGIAAQLQGSSRPAFLISGDAAADTGFTRDSDSAFALRQKLGRFGFTFGAEFGEAYLGNTRLEQRFILDERERRPFSTFSIAADRRFGSLETVFGLSWLQEDETILGGFFHESFGVGGADTLFFDSSAALHLAGNWRLGASLRQSVTRPKRTGLVAQGSQFTSNAWSLDVTRNGAFMPNDSIGLRVSQPLRVSSGSLNLDLPVAFDYTNLTAQIDSRQISLSPSGRELMSEISWNGPLKMGLVNAGNAGVSVYFRRQPGHFADAPDDAGVALRWNKAF